MVTSSMRASARSVRCGPRRGHDCRDERAPQLCAETLLTLVQNGYQPPPSADQLKTPKRQRFALRSLALGENFLGGREQGRAGDNDTTPEQYGAKLALGSQVRGSANLQFGTAHAAGPH